MRPLVYALIAGLCCAAASPPVRGSEPCFTVASYPRSSPAGRPYLYTPSFGPGAAVCFKSEDQDAILVKRCQEYAHGGVTLRVDTCCAGRCTVWRATIQFSDALAHAPLDYEYPGFRPSAWYTEFWDYLSRQPGGPPIDPAKLRAGFWALFIEHCPKSFDDLLKQQFGLEPVPAASGDPPAGGLVNLLPGMRLRVESSVWQDVAKSNADGLAEKHRGYVQAGMSYLRVSRQYGTLSTAPPVQGYYLSFDPFLGHVTDRFGALGDPQPGNRRSGPVDLHITKTKYANYRLYVPPTYTAGSERPAEFAPNKYFLVVGATEARSLSIQSGLPERLSKLTAWEGAGADLGEREYFAFRGRVAVVPEVAVLLDGREEYLAVGSTFRQVADRLSGSDEKSGVDACLRRRWQNILCPVRFCGETPREFDLPIAKGDCFTWCP